MGGDTPLFFIVVFSKRRELKKIMVDSPDTRVVKRDRLHAAIRHIWDDSPDALSKAGVEEVYSRLRSLTQVTKKQKKGHIENIEQRFERQANQTEATTFSV